MEGDVPQKVVVDAARHFATSACAA